MITNQIFNSEDWKTLYPQEEYGKDTAKLMFHYLIALGQPDSNILPHITTKSFSVLTNVDYRPGHYKLTPLIIAVLKCRVAIVKAILARFATDPQNKATYLNQADASGFTALHHAAICSEEIAQLLKDAGANTMARTLHNGTPDDISRLTSRGIAPWTAGSTYIQTKEGQIVAISTLSKEKLKELTGLEEYRDVSYVPPHRLRKFWELPPPDGMSNNAWDLYQRFKTEPPKKVLVQPSEELQKKSIYGLELVARENIPIKTSVCFYTGEFDPRDIPKSFVDACHPKESATFLLGNVNAAHYGNVARFINWGFPNVIYNEDFSIAGLGESPIVAIEEIKKGELILVDYGPGTVDVMLPQPHVLFGKEKMEVFFQQGLGKVKNDVDDALAKLKAGLRGADIAFVNLKSKTLYALSNRVALLHLHFRGLVSAGEWEKYLTTPGAWPLIEQWGAEFPPAHRYTLVLISAIKRFEGRLAGNPELRKIAGEWVLKSVGELSLMTILKGMDIIAENPEATKLDVDELHRRLADYDWRNDEQAVYSFENIANDVYKRTIEEGFTHAQFLMITLRDRKSLIESGVPADDERFRLIEWCLNKEESK